MAISYRPRRLSAVLAFVLLLWVASGMVTYAGDVSGTLTQDTTFTAGETTTVVGDLTVQAGVALTIEAGATVEVDGNHSITVNGEVDANGTSSDPITLTSAQSDPSSGDWNGLSFTGEVTNSSMLDHVEIKYASTGISANSVSSAAPLQLQNVTIEQVGDNGLSVVNAEVEVTGGRIENFGGRGIYLNGGGTDAMVDGVTVEQNGVKVRGGSCIRVRRKAALTLTQSDLKRCEVGLDISNGDGVTGPQTVTATGNTVTENKIGVRVFPGDSDSNRGFNPQPYPDLEIRMNRITSNIDWAIRIDTGKNARETELNFTDNWWGTTDGVNVAERIRDQSDDGGSAFVEFLPMWDSPPGESPSLTRTGPGGQTFWNGRIEQTRSWRRADGPHVAVGPVVVNKQKSLTVERGRILHRWS